MEKIDYVLEKTNLYEQIVEALEQVIIQSDGKEEKLPSEQELSKQFNVSKAVVREALKVLKDRGLIQSRNGDGSYISKPNTDTVASAINRIIKMDKINNQDLHGIRLILESTIEQMENFSLPFEERNQIDVDFHITLARASRNELLATFVEVMMTLLKEYMLKGFYSSNYDKNETLNEHREIIKAIKLKDQDYGEKAILAHIFAARENVSAYEHNSGFSPEGEIPGCPEINWYRTTVW